MDPVIRDPGASGINVDDGLVKTAGLDGRALAHRSQKSNLVAGFVCTTVRKGGAVAFGSD